MSHALAWLLSAAFAALGVWHFYMAAFGTGGGGAAVPSKEGQPLFVPSTRSTVAVGIVLVLFALLVAATSGLLSVGLPARLLSWLCYALALGLFARAVGDFKYVGFFKKVRGSRFAKLDTMLYSPLCLLLSVGVTAVAFKGGNAL